MKKLLAFIIILTTIFSCSDKKSKIIPVIEVQESYILQEEPGMTKEMKGITFKFTSVKDKSGNLKGYIVTRE